MPHAVNCDDPFAGSAADALHDDDDADGFFESDAVHASDADGWDNAEDGADDDAAGRGLGLPDTSPRPCDTPDVPRYAIRLYTSTRPTCRCDCAARRRGLPVLGVVELERISYNTATERGYLAYVARHGMVGCWGWALPRHTPELAARIADAVDDGNFMFAHCKFMGLYMTPVPA